MLLQASFHQACNSDLKQYSGGGRGATKAQVVVTVRRRIVVPIRPAQIGRFIVPTAAAIHAVGAPIPLLPDSYKMAKCPNKLFPVKKNTENNS